MWKKAHFHNIIFAARNHPTPIRTEPDGIDATSVTFVSVNASFPSNVPNFKICIQRAWRKELPKWMEIYGYAIRSMTCKSAYNCTHIFKRSVKANSWLRQKYKRSKPDGGIIHLQDSKLTWYHPMLIKGSPSCLLLASSRSQSLIVPLAAPATTTTSAESNVTDSTALVWPDKLYKQRADTSSLLVSWPRFWQ